MMDFGPGVRRLCIAAAWDAAPGRAPPADGPLSLVRAICADIRIDRVHWEVRHRAALGALPPGIDEPAVLGDFVSVARGAARRNGAIRQLRLAFYEGITYLHGAGLSGPAVVRVQGLFECPDVAATLAGHPRTRLAVILTDHLRRELGDLSRASVRAAIDPVIDGHPVPAWVELF